MQAHEEAIELRIESSKTPAKPPWLQPVQLNLLALSSLVRIPVIVGGDSGSNVGSDSG